MIVSIIIGGIVGLIAAAFFSSSIIGWIAGVAVFLFCLPGALIGGAIYDYTSYKEDRADYRQMMSDIAAEERNQDLIDAMHDEPKVYIDKRRQSVHLHGNSGSETLRRIK